MTGHYFCHPHAAKHVDRDFRISWRNADSSKGVNWREVEANRFAAALLVPEQFLRRDLDKVSTFDETTIKRLESRYKVSPVAIEVSACKFGGCWPPNLSNPTEVSRLRSAACDVGVTRKWPGEGITAH
jgi:Zn-dependent peptidase ImmA (M78 family)